MITAAEARRRSKLPEIVAEVAAKPERYCSVDGSLHQHKRSGSKEPWNEWEWPRRLAALRALGP